MIAIRFDGPPGPTSGHFIEVERDGAGISFGEWKRDENSGDWLLELPEVALLEDVAEAGEKAWPHMFNDLPQKINAKRRAYESLYDALVKLKE